MVAAIRLSRTGCVRATPIAIMASKLFGPFRLEQVNLRGVTPCCDVLALASFKVFV
jgi:hypothetical protein